MLGLKKDSETRFNIFLDTVKSTKEIWGLQSDDGWVICDSTEYEDTGVMPFWSHEAYAKHLAKEEWSHYKPTQIDIDSFIDNWLKGMNDDELLVGVNWNLNLIGKEIEPIELAKLLIE